MLIFFHLPDVGVSIYWKSRRFYPRTVAGTQHIVFAPVVSFAVLPVSTAAHQKPYSSPHHSRCW